MPERPGRRRVPRPSRGRIVLWCEAETTGPGGVLWDAVEWPAVVLLVDREDPRRVQLRVFGREDKITYCQHADSPDVPQGGRWRYPPREEGTIEI